MSGKSSIWLLVVIACFLGVLARAADDKTKANTKPVPPGEAPLPKSFFEINAPNAKDPFFPLSTRSAVPLPVVTNSEPSALSAGSFRLGLSISSYQSLAIINNKSLAEGERALVPLLNSTAKVGVTVLKIKTVSALVQVDGYKEPIELFLPKSDQ